MGVIRWSPAISIRPDGNGCALVSALGLLLLSSFSPAVAGPTSRHVLVLYGAGKDLPMNLLIDSHLRSTFREKRSDGVELYSEYIDSARFPDQGYPRKLLEFLQDKYSARGLDLIIVVESSALDQVQ